MARPVTMMSAALLTAAAAGILPHLIPLPGASPMPPPVIGVPSPQSPGMPSTLPSGGMPQPGFNPVPSSMSLSNSPPSMPCSAAAPTTLNQGHPRLISLAGAVITFQRNGSAYSSHLLLRSLSGSPQQITIELAPLQDRNGEQLNAQIDNPPKDGFAIEAFGTVNRAVQISLSSSSSTPNSGATRQSTSGAAAGTAQNQPPMLPGCGWLRILATKKPDNNSNPKAFEPNAEPQDPGYLYLPITIAEPKLTSGASVLTIFFLSFSVAGLIVVITIFSLRKKGIPLRHRMGSATWSFQQSWGSNVTIGAAILATFLTLLAFPDHPQLMDKNSYSLLQGLFAALVMLAPLIYGLIRRDVQANANGLAAVDSQGFVIMFLLGGGFVLWGAIGQVFTLGVLTEEFVLSGSLRHSIGLALEILTGLLFVLLVVYGLRSLYQTVKQLSADSATAEPTEKVPHFRSGFALTATTAAKLKSPMPEWPLL